MAHKLDSERVLATVDWADAVLIEHRLESGYAVDARLNQQRNLRRRTGPQPGKFARYQRGDCVPSQQVVDLLDTRGGLSVGRLKHPLYTVLRVGWDSRKQWQARDDLENALIDTERWLSLRLTRFVDHGWTYERRPLSPTMLESLAATGTGHALTALLTAAVQQADYGEDPRLAIQRAFHCMVLAFARGEFRLTWPLVAARVRQQILDRIVVDGLVADTAAFDLIPALVSARRMLKEMQAGGALRAADQRTYVRSWLRSHVDSHANWQLAFVTPEAAALSLRGRPVALRMESRPTGQFNHMRDFGRRAKAVLAPALGDYVIEPCEA